MPWVTEQSTPTQGDEDREPLVPPDSRDPWSIWFSRLIQVVGLGLIVHQALARDTDRPWLLLVACAMMIGGLGLQLVLRWLLGRLS